MVIVEPLSTSTAPSTWRPFAEYLPHAAPPRPQMDPANPSYLLHRTYYLYPTISCFPLVLEVPPHVNPSPPYLTWSMDRPVHHAHPPRHRRPGRSTAPRTATPPPAASLPRWWVKSRPLSTEKKTKQKKGRNRRRRWSVKHYGCSLLRLILLPSHVLTIMTPTPLTLTVCSSRDCIRTLIMGKAWTR